MVFDFPSERSCENALFLYKPAIIEIPKMRLDLHGILYDLIRNVLSGLSW